MLSVAGIRIEVSSMDLSVADAADPVYERFVTASPATDGHGADMAVRVVPGPPAEPPGPVLFETGSSWTLHEAPGSFRFVFAHPGEEVASLQAVCDAAFAEVAVHVAAQADSGAPRVVPFSYPLDQLLVMNHLALRRGVIVHAAGVVLHGCAVVLCGVSGAGKSTVARLLADGGHGGDLLSDDRIILRHAPDGRYAAWGTPWPGDAGAARNAGAPLGALVFLTQAPAAAPACDLLPLRAGQALRRLLPVVSCPWYDEERLSAVLDTCAAIVEGRPSYELRFSLDAPVVGALHALAADLAAH